MGKDTVLLIFVIFAVDECVELSSRVHKLRQNTGEYEREIATQKSRLDRFSEVMLKTFF